MSLSIIYVCERRPVKEMDVYFGDATSWPNGVRVCNRIGDVQIVSVLASITVYRGFEPRSCHVVFSRGRVKPDNKIRYLLPLCLAHSCGLYRRSGSGYYITSGQEI